MNISFKSFSFLLITCFLTNGLQGQLLKDAQQSVGAVGPDIVQTAVPFLTIAPDSRAGGMGDLGVATTPDIASMHWNPAKYAFIQDKEGVEISYIPWLRNLVPDINLAYLAGFYKLDQRQTISASLLYFSLGQVIFKDAGNNDMGQFNPNEFSIDAAYSRLLADNLSGGMAFRFIYSDFGKAYVQSVGETQAGISFAADVSVYYRKPIEIQSKEAKLSFGLNISNMGSKISYTQAEAKEFIPTNLRLGSALTINADKYNSFTFALDLNKLLVPTPPIYDSTGTHILLGMDPNVSVPTGMIHSFYDAPGGFKEELQEIQWSVGVEYWYYNQFALRTGYFHESPDQGNRQYYEIGVGVKLNVLSIDFAYLVPSSGNISPLANTMRFTLCYNLGPPAKR